MALAEHTTQGRLGHHRRRIEIVLHVHDGTLRIHNPEIHNSIDSDSHIVFGNDILWRHIHSYRADADTEQSVDKGKNDDDARPSSADDPSSEYAPPKNYGAFVLWEDIEALHNKSSQHSQQDCRTGQEVHGCLLLLRLHELTELRASPTYVVSWQWVKARQSSLARLPLLKVSLSADQYKT